MKNFVYIFHVEKSTPDDAAANAAWSAWFASLGEHIVDSGNAFAPDSEAQIKNGTVTMDHTSASGYTIVKANDLKEAVTWAMTCPLALTNDGSVNVYETEAM